MMTNLKFAHEVEMAVEECCSCGIQFALTADFQRRVQSNHESFYCPAGHSQFYPAKSKEEKLKAQVEELERRVSRKQKEKEWAQQEARSAKNRERAQKAAKTRLKNRVSKGVCPCCNRSFANLKAHMKGQHPDFAGEG